MKKVFLLLFFGLHTLMYAQELTENDLNAIKYALQIDIASLQNKVFTLSSPMFEGRAVGTEGNAAAARYLAKCMTDYKIQPAVGNSYFQHIPVYRIQSVEKNFHVNNFNYRNDYTYGNSISQEFNIDAEEVIFAGYGIYSASYNDFENVDISDEVIMIMEGGSPMSKFGVPFTKNKLNSYSIDYIRENKPRAILVVRNGYNTYTNYATDRLVFDDTQAKTNTIPEITINELLANKLLSPVNKSIKQLQYEIERDNKSHSFEIETEVEFNGSYIYTPLNSNSKENNLVGIIKGDELDEYVVLTAHYDSKGKYTDEEIYYGAENNASGVAAVLEIARLFSEAKKAGVCLRRSVILLLTTAKESGLNGSNFYVNNPLFPLEKTVAAVNLDMLGLSSEEYKDNTKNYLYLVSRKTQSDDLLRQVKEANQITQLTLSFKGSDTDNNEEFSEENFDQYSFSKKNIPSVTFTSGYQSQLEFTQNNKDKFESINFIKLTERTQLAFLTLWRLVNE